MADLVIDATQVRLVKLIEGFTGPVGADTDAGELVRPDNVSGQLVMADSLLPANFLGAGVAINTVLAYNATTIVRKGTVNLGDALAALAYGDPVYVSDNAGKLADAPGTENKQVGTVDAYYGETTPLKVLRVDL